MRFNKLKIASLSILLFSINSCKQPEKDPVSTLNGLVKEYGFIGFQNPLEETSSGTLIAGRPTALSFVAHKNDCFPEDLIPRYSDHSNVNKKYQYTFQGNLGFLTSGNPIISAGLSLKSDHFVNVELSGLTINYMSSIDVSDWYREGMNETCKDYLNEVGFIIQSLSADTLKINIKKISGNSIGLNADNISQFFKFETGVDWEIVDEYNVEITTPKFIGYQLGRLRRNDNGMSLYRAMSVKDDQFIFESIGLFDNADNSKKVMSTHSEIDDHSIYLD